MAHSTPRRLVRLSLISITATAAVTSFHHVYRLGLEVLLPAIIVTLLPYLLMRWYRSSGHRAALWSYTGATTAIVVWFGFIDGFLDHVVKGLGLQNTTFLPGGEQEVVPTVFHLWSPAASILLYEGTGILTSVLAVVATHHTYRLLRASRTARTVESRDPADA